jgi:hypothetical protein
MDSLKTELKSLDFINQLKKVSTNYNVLIDLKKNKDSALCGGEYSQVQVVVCEKNVSPEDFLELASGRKQALKIKGFSAIKRDMHPYSNSMILFNGDPNDFEFHKSSDFQSLVEKGITFIKDFKQ